MAVGVIAAVAWWTNRSVEQSLRTNLAAHLTALLNAEVGALEFWLRTQQTSARAIAADPAVAEAIAAIVEAGPEPPASPGGELIAHVAALRREIEPHLQAHGYRDFTVVTPSGDIVAAGRDELVGAKNLLGEKDLEVLKAVLEGQPRIVPPVKSRILLPDVDGTMRAGVPTMFVAAPVYSDDGEVLAALCLRIAPEGEFSKILHVARAGKTGESYAFNREGIMISASRFDDELKQIGLLPDDDATRSILNIRLCDPGVDMTAGGRPKLRRQEQPLTKMAASAVAGNSGVDVEGYRDYRGVMVVGAWKWLDAHGIGVATEVDQAEAYRPLAALRVAFKLLAGLLGLCAVLLFVFGIMLARLDRSARRAAVAARQLGQYALDARIGEGGMGVVYRAHHAMLQRPVAVKLLHVDRTNKQTIARFEREVQLTSQLSHPNTIAIYDYGRTPEGIFYYAMEYLDGITLQELVARFGAQPEGRVIYILKQLCGSLSEAHAIGLCHRDVKPENIFLTQRGGRYDFVKLLDFGLVKAVDGVQSSSVTATGVLTGTPLYLSPEAIQDPDEVDSRSDLYAVGAVAYFLLTGRTVFEGKSIPDICTKHVTAQPEPPSKRIGKPIDPELERLILQCLAKKKDDRPPNAEWLERQLDQCPAASQWTAWDAKAWWTVHLSGQQTEQTAGTLEATLYTERHSVPSDGSES